jgi:hypothetical protein
MSKISVILPPIFAQDEKLWKHNRVVQLHVPSLRLEAVVKRNDKNRVKGYLFTSVSGERHQILALANGDSLPNSEKQ